ncbi:MAG: PD-(D/E)XK nuclease family protein [Bacteroidetes bacterium]|nr:PD-(D/E)XK nuclease family protein [Bacteroidota bacterium]
MSIILAKNFDGKLSENFASVVKEKTKQSCRTGNYDFVYIVPTRRRVRELQRELVDNFVFGKLPVFTLELYAHEIFSRLNDGKRIISPSMQGMFVSEVISGGEFRFFKYASFRPGTRKGVAPIGTIKKIVDQIDYLKENGITPEDYEYLVSVSEESERHKLEEFVRIYSGYEDSLGNEFIDSAGLMSHLNSRLSTSSEVVKEIHPEKCTFYVEGFYSFKKPELEFLRRLSARMDFSFLIKLDCSDRNEDIFRTMLATSDELVSRGFKPQEAGADSSRQDNSSLRDYLALNLFSDETPRDKLDLKDKVYVVSVRDSLREAEFVAEKIKDILKKDPGKNLDRICIASYLPQNYSSIFREVFPKYGIPANITDRYTLETNSVVNAILSFIDIKITDYERVALLRAVTNRVLTISENTNASEAGSILYDAAASCRFERGLKNFRETIEARLGILRGLSQEGTDENAAQIAHDIGILVKARQLIDTIERKLTPFSHDLTPEEFQEAVGSLVAGLRVYENIARLNVNGISAEIVERDAQAMSSFQEVLDEVVEVETVNGGKRLPVEIWIENLRAALSLTRYNIRQKYGFGVYVTALEEIRGLEFDHLFIVGLTEGELPTKYVPEIFLPLNVQKENRQMQPYLQRHLFYQAAGSFNKSLCLIHPVQREEVRLIRSSFIDAFTDVAEVSHLDEASAEEGVVDIYNFQQFIEAESVCPNFYDKVPGDEAAKLLPHNLERCKAAESARYEGLRDSEFTGKLTEKELVDKIDAEIGGRTFSAAQIESLTRCGFQYFSRRVLQIAEVPDIETSLSAIERGAVLHKILYKFYDELSKEGNLGGSKDELELLLDIGCQILDQLGIKHDLFEVERNSILGTASVPGTLGLFLSKVQAKLSEYGFVPEKFEFGFGMRSGSGEEAAGPVKIGDVSLRGKIDRMDSNLDGLTIFDYKTSYANPVHQDVIGEKISPQLLLYLKALDEVMRLGGEKGIVAGAAFISLNRDRLLSAEDGKDLIDFIVRDDNGELRYNKSFESARKTPSTAEYPKTMPELLQETESFVNEKVQEARSGRFNLTTFPREKVCIYCPYSEACRIALTGESLEASESA